MILVITGNGKGKTTSAIGTAIRGSGWGKKVAIVFFDKGGSHYGEQHIFDILQESISVLRFGQQRFDEDNQKFRFENTEEDKKEAEKAMSAVLDLYNKEYNLIVCDEIINCLNLGLVGEDSVKKLINQCPAGTDIILTGRNAPEWMVEKADLVSEVKEVKHYFNKVKKAVKGIDY